LAYIRDGQVCSYVFNVSRLHIVMHVINQEIKLRIPFQRISITQKLH